MRDDETFICDKCDEIKDADFIATLGNDLLCENCFDKAMRGGTSNGTS
jgi:formylmethanofuran dehydrogenase subunit E